MLKSNLSNRETHIHIKWLASPAKIGGLADVHPMCISTKSHSVDLD